MTYIEKHCRPGVRHARRVKRTVVTGVVAAVLVSAPPIAASAAPLATGSSLSASASPLAASTTATKAQIDALRRQITAEAGQIHGYVDQFDQASSEAVVLAQELTAQRSQLVGLRRGLTKAQAALREAAIQSYTGSNAETGLTEVSGSANAAIGTEFLSVASSDISDLEDNYRAEQGQVTSAIARLTAEQRANARAIAAASTARSEALSTATDDQAQLTALQDKLAKLGAAQGGPSNNGLVKSTQGSTSTTNPPSSGSGSSGGGSTTTTTVPATGATTSTTVPVTTTTTTVASGGGGGGNAGGVWLELRECESGDNYQENTGNGFYGAYQFSEQTWSGMGYPGYPYQESPAMQDAAAKRLQAEAGWDQWPACAAKLGLT